MDSKYSSETSRIQVKGPQNALGPQNVRFQFSLHSVLLWKLLNAFNFFSKVSDLWL